jgi:ribonuclease HI
MSSLVAYVDGGSLGNPGPSGIGVVIDGSENGRIEIKKWIGHQDNNVAEYVALLEALQCALELSAGTLHVFSDSEVVVRQMRGEYTCRNPRLYSLHWTCRKLARGLTSRYLTSRVKAILKPTVWPAVQPARGFDSRDSHKLGSTRLACDNFVLYFRNVSMEGWEPTAIHHTGSP